MKQLNPLEFQILALMGVHEMAGRAIAQSFEKEVGPISYGTLYTTLRRLKEGGFVESREDEDADGRLRLFKLTGNGRLAVRTTRAFFRDLSSTGLRPFPEAGFAGGAT